jgi:pimeloyl-ACP methyl ester carboxylesterase
VYSGEGFANPLPVGATPAARYPKAAVFFIHPTTFKGAAGQFNQDVADAAANQWADESSVARQASVFSACCAVYSPRYRAASYASFASTPVREAAFALAYTDIERAFDAFLKTIGNRPFIIAGHSQGAFHSAMLLEKRIEGTPLQKRMVAAYIIGINLAQGDFGKRFKSVKPCARPAQTGCVVQWNAYLADADVAKFAGYSQSTYVQKYGDDAGKLTLCVNPLTFDARRAEANASAAKGAVPGSPGLGALLPLKAKAVAARCEQGLLLVTPDKALDLAPLAGGSMHYHDLGLFWADVRANAALRVAAFAKAGK